VERNESSLRSVPVELWCFSLDQSKARVESFHQSLAPSEQMRASRFAYQREQTRYVVGRYALRCILAQKLATRPRQVVLKLGENDKPMLCSDAALSFNLSHTGPLAMLALVDQSPSCNSEGLCPPEVGIDIELPKPLEDAQSLFEHCLCERELQCLRALNEEEQRSTFMDIWVRKEACLKALGVGLQVEPHCFDSGWRLNNYDSPARASDSLQIPGQRTTGLTQLKGLHQGFWTLPNETTSEDAEVNDPGRRVSGRCHGAVSLVDAIPLPRYRSFDFEECEGKL
jgi:4'-phosphopantetheinyl transferase